MAEPRGSTQARNHRRSISGTRGPRRPTRATPPAKRRRTAAMRGARAAGTPGRRGVGPTDSASGAALPTSPAGSEAVWLGGGGQCAGQVVGECLDLGEEFLGGDLAACAAVDQQVHAATGDVVQLGGADDGWAACSQEVTSGWNVMTRPWCSWTGGRRDPGVRSMSRILAAHSGHRHTTIGWASVGLRALIGCAGGAVVFSAYFDANGVAGAVGVGLAVLLEQQGA